MPITRNQSVKRLNLRNEFPEFSDATPEQKREILPLVGEFLVEQINKFLDSSNSPVSGGSFKKKKADGKSSKLLEEGDMRSQITFAEFRDGIDVGIFPDAPEVDKLKSHNHNLGVTLPQRQFIPEKEQKFKRQINAGIRKIIERIVDGN